MDHTSNRLILYALRPSLQLYWEHAEDQLLIHTFWTREDTSWVCTRALEFLLTWVESTHPRAKNASQAFSSTMPCTCSTVPSRKSFFKTLTGMNLGCRKYSVLVINCIGKAANSRSAECILWFSDHTAIARIVVHSNASDHVRWEPVEASLMEIESR